MLLLVVCVTQFRGVLRFSVSEQPQNQQQQMESAPFTVSKVFPATCTQHQLETIGYQLPAGECQKTFKNPWANKCSFSYATRCPGSYWLNDYYTALHAQQHKSKQFSSPRTALSVGCNKGMDAVNTLRMLAGDPTIDKDTWRGTFFGGNSNSSTKQQFEAGRCQQEFDDQFSVPVTTTTPMKAAVYCIEAMPVTAAKLTETAKQLQWHDRFHVIHAAVGAVDKESVLFPDLDKVGEEGKGLSDCEGKGAKKCKPVQQFTLDSLVDTFVVEINTHDNDNHVIEMISVDVEGFDWPVLLEGAVALKRTRYVELEYNWKGAWVQHKLSEMIETMKERGFACYWAGDAGHLWRITDCWLPHYDLKFWSNVACVNVLLPDTVTPSLAERMEATFLDTVAAGNTLQYNRPLAQKNYTRASS
jgi:FkbM family methyltransferase